MQLLRHVHCSLAMQNAFSTGDGGSPRDCSMAVAVMFHSVLGRARCEPAEVEDILRQLTSGSGAGSFRSMANAAFRICCVDGSRQLAADIVRSSEDPAHPCAASALIFLQTPEQPGRFRAHKQIADSYVLCARYTFAACVLDRGTPLRKPLGLHAWSASLISRHPAVLPPN